MTHWSRRELITVLGVAPLAARCAPAAKELSAAGAAAAPGRLGLSRLAPLESGQLVPAAAREAMAGAVMAATGAESPQAAAELLFRPDDTVGIKLNCLAGPPLSPRPELVEALAELVALAGVPARRVLLIERSTRELRRAGFRGGGPFRTVGIDRDWDRDIATSGEIGSCYARVVTEACTALVGFGVVKDHDLAGVSGSLKNWYGVIHNPNKYHDSSCDPYVADVVRHPHVASKLRLTVLDGVTAQCHGGPALRSDELFDLHTVLATTDPVAADAWAWQQLDSERQRRKMRTLEQAGRAPRFIATAAGYGLGVADPNGLEEVWA
jgi:uncharacterized protein (DUF362 family)